MCGMQRYAALITQIAQLFDSLSTSDLYGAEVMHVKYQIP